MGETPNGMHFWVLTFPKSQNRVCPKLMAYPIRIWTVILFPSLCNNYFNQFLAELNDWVKETRKVVECLMGSPIDIWLFPIGPKGQMSPPLSLGNHAPISLFVALT